MVAKRPTTAAVEGQQCQSTTPEMPAGRADIMAVAKYFKWLGAAPWRGKSSASIKFVFGGAIPPCPAMAMTTASVPKASRPRAPIICVTAILALNGKKVSMRSYGHITRVSAAVKDMHDQWSAR